VLLCQPFFVATWTPDERKLATDLGGGEDVLDGHGNLGANAITLDQADGVAALQAVLAVSASSWCCCRRDMF
jgi:hypothetical protein